MEMDHQRRNIHVATGERLVGASEVRPALSSIPGRTSTKPIGVFIAPGRTTLLRIVHMVENDLGRMEGRRPS